MTDIAEYKIQIMHLLLLQTECVITQRFHFWGCGSRKNKAGGQEYTIMESNWCMKDVVPII